MKETQYPIGGFAPGNYRCFCHTCKSWFRGDKRAVQCEPCAIRMVDPQYVAPAPVNQGEKILRWVKASERLPSPGTKVFIRSGDADPYKGVGGIDGINRVIQHGWTNTEWLEELDQPAAQDVPDTNVGDIEEGYQFYCTKPSDIPCTQQCEQCRKYAPPAPTKEGAEIPIPDEIMQWIEEKSIELYNGIYPRPTLPLMTSMAIGMYRKMQEEKAELLQALIADQAKELSSIQSALSFMTAERDAALAEVKEADETCRDVLAGNYITNYWKSRKEANEYRKVLEIVAADIKNLRWKEALAMIRATVVKYKVWL